MLALSIDNESELRKRIISYSRMSATIERIHNAKCLLLDVVNKDRKEVWDTIYILDHVYEHEENDKKSTFTFSALPECIQNTYSKENRELLLDMPYDVYRSMRVYKRKKFYDMVMKEHPELLQGDNPGYSMIQKLCSVG